MFSPPTPFYFSLKPNTNRKEVWEHFVSMNFSLHSQHKQQRQSAASRDNLLADGKLLSGYSNAPTTFERERERQPVNWHQIHNVPCGPHFCFLVWQLSWADIWNSRTPASFSCADFTFYEEIGRGAGRDSPSVSGVKWNEICTGLLQEHYEKCEIR